MLDEKNRADFVVALGDEFCAVFAWMDVHRDDLCHQMAYEVFSSALGEDFTDDSLRDVRETQLEELAAGARALLECPTIKSVHLREIIRRTLARR